MVDLHVRWPHRWLTAKAESRNSGIHGLGVFAKTLINKDENIAALGGVIIPVSEIEEYWKLMGHVGIQIDDGFFIVPTTREELKLNGVFNHSCAPNIGFSTSINFIAIEDIKPGDELVFDYAFNETRMENFACSCGVLQCRKTITGEDWKQQGIISRYAQYYSPYLKRKLKNETAS